MPLLGDEEDNGYTDEEMKLKHESRKILGLPELRVSPTCVRVPVMVGHSIAARATFRAEVDRDARPARRSRLPGPGARRRPRRRWSTPAATRSRWAACARDLDDPRALNFFVVGDNLLKGAALNTVQIAEPLHERGLVGRSLRPSAGRRWASAGARSPSA